MKLRLFIAAVLLVGMLLAGAHPAQAQGVISFQPNPVTATEGSRFIVSLWVDETPDLSGVQLNFTYDHFLLDVVSLQAGSAWPEDGTAVSQATWTTEPTRAEAISFAASLVDEQQMLPAGELVQIEFQAVSPIEGQTTTLLAAHPALPFALLDAEGNALASETPEALSITIEPAPVITARVALQAPQGRLAQAEVSGTGFDVEQTDHPGAVLTFVPPAGSEVSLLASAECHLPALETRVSAPEGDFTTLLLAGDTNGDGAINISDLSIIGAHFFTRGDTTCANLDGDLNGNVNILDLAMAARNFGWSGPTGWDYKGTE